MTEQEFACEWTCPGCGHFQHDSVNPELGPFVTCICEKCQQVFNQADLDATSQRSWDTAIAAAEAA